MTGPRNRETPITSWDRGLVQADPDAAIREIRELRAACVRAEEALNQAHNDLRAIAEASPNWMEPDAVAESERRKSQMARQAQMKVEAVLLAAVPEENEG